MIEHWDGTQWNIVSSPDERMTVDTRQLWSVSAISINDVWTVGYYCCGPDGLTTLIEHWDGVQWSIVSSPNPSTDNNYLKAVVAISGNDVWTVGYYGSSVWQTLTEHYTNQCIPPSPSPSPSASATPTSVPTYTPTTTSTSTTTPTTTPSVTRPVSIIRTTVYDKHSATGVRAGRGMQAWVLNNETSLSVRQDS